MKSKCSRLAESHSTKYLHNNRRMKQIDLKGLFTKLQEQMELRLTTAREFIDHPGTKGDALEYAWIEWLRCYLPSRYSVDKAIVIDSEGQLSDQIDLVIYDRWFTPFIFNQGGLKYIPAEGVYAVFEVKPDIRGSIKKGETSISYIQYAAKKIESVRRLKRTSTHMVNSGNVSSARALPPIIGGILCGSNGYSHNNKTEKVEELLSRLSGLEGIDCGCIMEHGSFIVDYEGCEDKSLPDFDERIKSYYNDRIIKGITFSKAENSLVTFFMQLTRYLQAIGTVPAIDMNAYLSSIDEQIDPNPLD